MKTIIFISIAVLALSLFSSSKDDTPETLGYDFQELTDAIQEVETGSGPNGGIGVIGDNGRALGPLQIHKIYHKDCIEYAEKNPKDIPFGLIIGGKPNYRRCLDELHYSQFMFWLYAKRYSRTEMANLDKNKYLTLSECETIARKHNGGPKGDTKKATVKYWNKVKKVLESNHD